MRLSLNALLCTEPWAESWVRAISLFATTPLNSGTAALLAVRARQSRGIPWAAAPQNQGTQASQGRPAL